MCCLAVIGTLTLFGQVNCSSIRPEDVARKTQGLGLIA
jgi:hypothetical protein